MTEIIQTDRLTLRPPKREDAASVARLVGDLTVSRWLTSVPHPYTVQDADDFIDRQLNESATTYVVEHDQAVIGCIGSENELGYWFGAPFWGRGFATEAARAVTDRFFQGGGSNLTSGYFLGNARSANVLTKLGFKATKLVDGYVRALGQSMALQKMKLTFDEWEAVR